MCQLYNHPFAVQFPAIQLVHGIVGVSVVVKLHKAESILEQDFADLAESAEEPLQVALSNTVAEVADVDPGHVFGLLAAEPDEATGA